MTMIRVQPVKVEVRTGLLGGEPKEIAWANERVRVSRIVRVRHEDRAYQVAVGPRTVFEVEAGDALLTLSYRHRAHSWTIEGLDDAVFETVSAGRFALAPLAAPLAA